MPLFKNRTPALGVLATGALMLCFVSTTFAQVPVPPVRVLGIEAVQSVEQAQVVIPPGGNLSQAVPGPAGNGLPLLANKPTYVRVYLDFAGDPPMSSPNWGVAGILVITSPAPTPGGPPRVTRVGGGMQTAMFSAPHRGLFELRDTQTADFVVPPELLKSATTLSVTFTEPYTVYPTPQKEDASGLSRLTCDASCAQPVTISFIAPVEMRLRVFGLRYGREDSAHYPFVPEPVDYDRLQRWLLRAFPISRLIMSTQEIAAPRDFETIGPGEDGCNLANTYLAIVRELETRSGVDNRTHYYGMVVNLAPNDPKGSFFMRGCAADIPQNPDPTVVASGPTGPTGTGNYDWDTDGSWGDWYGAHELGHTLGRYHDDSGCGDDSEGEGHYPYPYGLIGPLSHSVTGYDVGWESTVSRGVRSSPVVGGPSGPLPYNRNYDVMSYCSNIWISDYSYQGILTRLQAEMALSPASSNRGQSSSAMPSIAMQSQAGSWVDVFGTANLTKRSGSIVAVRSAQLPHESSTAVRDVTLRTLNASGKVLGSFSAGFHPNSNSTKSNVRGSFEGSVPASPDLASIQLVQGDTILATFTAPPAPKIHALALSRQLKLAKTANLRETALSWGGTSPVPASDVASTTYDVEASDDGGKTWKVLAANLKDAGTNVDLSGFTQGTTINIRVLANTGFVTQLLSQMQVQQ